MSSLTMLMTARVSAHHIVRQFLRTVTSRGGLTGDAFERSFASKEAKSCFGGLRCPYNLDDETPYICQVGSNMICEKPSVSERKEQCYNSILFVDIANICYSCVSTAGGNSDPIDNGDDNCVFAAAEAL